MSFGCSISDVALLVKLAVKIVNDCRNACGEYAELTREVSGLNAVLQRLEMETARPSTLSDRSGSDYKEELESIAGGCRSNLEKLDKILEKYISLNPEIKSRTKLWKKVKFASGETVDLADMRGKITFYTSALGLYINLTTAGSVGRIEKQMDEAGGDLKQIKSIVNDIICLKSDSKGEGSELTTYEGDEKAVWREFRRELIKDGFSSPVLKRHKATIQAYIQELSTRGVLDEPNEFLESSEIEKPSPSADHIEIDRKDPRDVVKASGIQLDDTTGMDPKLLEGPSSIHIGPKLEVPQSKVSHESTVNVSNTCTDLVKGITQSSSIVGPDLRGLVAVIEPPIISKREPSSSVHLIDIFDVERTPLDKILFEDLHNIGSNRRPRSSLELVIAAKRVIQWLRNVRKEYVNLYPGRSAQQCHRYATMDLMNHVEPILKRWQRQVQTLLTERAFEGPAIKVQEGVVWKLNRRCLRLQHLKDEAAIQEADRPFIPTQSAPTFMPTDIDKQSGRVPSSTVWPSLVEKDPTLCSIHLRPTERAHLASLVFAKTTAAELLLSPCLMSTIDFAKPYLNELVDAANSEPFKEIAGLFSADPVAVEQWMTQIQSLWDLEHIEWQSRSTTFREYYCLKYMSNMLQGWRAAVVSTCLYPFWSDGKTPCHVRSVLLELEISLQIIQKKLDQRKADRGELSSASIIFEMLGF